MVKLTTWISVNSAWSFDHYGILRWWLYLKKYLSFLERARFIRNTCLVNESDGKT